MSKGTDPFGEMARDGDLRAIHQACYRFRYGESGAPKDENQAYRWCSKGHALGSPSSTVLLGEILVGGSEKRRDRDRARILYREAAEQGHSFAMYAFGVMLTEDPRNETDRDDGLYWLQRSADLGQEHAIEYLERLER